MTRDVKIFAKTIEQEAKEQILTLSNHPVSDGSKIRIMPDVHAGAGCTIGTTMTIIDRICPNLVGVDIGCGVLAVNLGVKKIDFDQLDSVIRWNVPAGTNIRYTAIEHFQFDEMRCPTADKVRANKSIGTLGGGNHFIEIDREKNGNLWLVIHSGSRHLGLEVANYYQKLAWEDMSKPSSDEVATIIAQYKEEGRQKEIASALAALKEKYIGCEPKDLAYLTGQHMADYLNDMRIVQRFSDANRKAIARIICRELKVGPTESFTTVHNYIDHDMMILRKGSVSAKTGEKLIIPMNMRDGSLICTGKGNPDWNYSAPHGAGRLMSRSKAKEQFTIEEYKGSMKGIYSTCISYDTLDENPGVYKDMKEIADSIKPTCKIEGIIKPVYNFKAP